MLEDYFRKLGNKLILIEKLIHINLKLIQTQHKMFQFPKIRILRASIILRASKR